MSTNTIDRANEVFWNELCGSAFAKALGIEDHSVESIKKFDQAYFDFYPYLLQHVDPNVLSGKKVLEIGLGYGTLGHKIAEVAGEYTGLDIAQGPVDMMNHRLAMFNLNGKAVRGSMLDCPMETASFDCVVSIGCFHHTGDVQRCLDEAYRVLKPGGQLIFMVYNRFSYLQWLKWPTLTFKALLNFQQSNESQRKAYDKNAAGDGAPETAFLSIRELKAMLRQFSNVNCYKENCTQARLGRTKVIPRDKLLPNLGKIAGLDVYVKAKKAV